MPLAYILRRVQASAGISSPDLNPEQRAFLLDFINEACEEIWDAPDLPVALQEVYTNVQANARIALPAFVGEIRACRNRRWDGLVTLSNIRARYCQEDWVNKWSKFRIIGESAIANEIVNAAPLKYVYPVIDNDLDITTLGPTVNSNSAFETITQTATTVTGTKNFLDINRISKNSVTPYDVVVKDANDNELAIIYANQLDSRYLIADVSAYPKIECCNNSYILEVLFKPRLPRLLNDTDEFPLAGYDNVIVLRTKQLLAEEQEGKEERAILMNTKSKDKIRAKVNDKTGTIQAKITTKRNGLYDLFPRRYYTGISSTDSIR